VQVVHPPLEQNQTVYEFPQEDTIKSKWLVCRRLAEEAAGVRPMERYDLCRTAVYTQYVMVLEDDIRES
jgi:hypothetical protein